MNFGDVLLSYLESIRMKGLSNVNIVPKHLNKDTGVYYINLSTYLSIIIQEKQLGAQHGKHSISHHLVEFTKIELINDTQSI